LAGFGWDAKESEGSRGENWAVDPIDRCSETRNAGRLIRS